jgi:DNA-binding NtrC family response regulator
MNKGILIADSDTELRTEMAEYFKLEGYTVETTDSAVHTLCSILEKETPVLLLGNDFDQKISSSDLVQLLKKCNRHLAIVLVTEKLELPQARKMREEKIFYHALQPQSSGDCEEIRQAVECAFDAVNKTQNSDPRSRKNLKGEVPS